MQSVRRRFPPLPVLRCPQRVPVRASLGAGAATQHVFGAARRASASALGVAGRRARPRARLPIAPAARKAADVRTSANLHAKPPHVQLLRGRSSAACIYSRYFLRALSKRLNCLSLEFRVGTCA
eukprot:2056715-Pleurochrysis_carterae.AAC.6